jgi:membrane protease YdiL (CAAX protease family)
VLARREEPFWGFGEILVGAAAFLVAIRIVVALADHFLGAAGAKLGYWVLAEEFVSYLVLFGVLKGMFYVQGQPLLQSLGWIRQAFSTLNLAMLGVLVFFVGVFLQILLRMPEDAQTPFERMLYGDPFSRFAIAAFGVTAGPVIEELLFRGLLQPVFVSVAGVFPGILITSALFALVHLPQNAGVWQSGLIIGIAGFGFGVVRHVTGSTRASSIMHVAYNALPFAITLMQGAPPNHK